MARGAGGRSRGSVLRRIGVAVAIVLALPIASIAVLALFEIPVSLALLRPQIESRVSAALDRSVAIEGALMLVPGTTVTLEARRLRIANPPDFEAPHFARAERARVAIDLPALFRSEIVVERLLIEGSDIQLESGADGVDNWSFGEPGKGPAPGGDGGPATELVRIGDVVLRSIDVRHRDGASGDSTVLELQEARGSVGRNEPLRLSAEGLLDGRPFAMAMKGGSLSAYDDASSPWPIDVELSIGDASLSGDIEIAGPRGTPTLRADMRGSVGESRFRGALQAETGASPPRISGRIDAAILDLGSLLIDESGTATPPEEPAPARDIREDIALGELAEGLEALRGLDADLVLHADRILGTPFPIVDASAHLDISDGALGLPMAATVSDVIVDGRLDLRAVDDSVALAIELASEDLDTDRIGGAVGRRQDLTGSFVGFALRVSAGGRTLHDALASLDARLNLERAEITYGGSSDRGPVKVELEDLEVVLPAGEALGFGVRGSLLRQPFTISGGGPGVSDLLAGGPLPVRVDARSVGSRLTLHGRTGGPERASATTLDISFEADRVGDLTRWLDSVPDADADLAIRGRLAWDGDAIRFESVRANLGRTALDGELSISRADGDPLVGVKARFDEVDTEELGGIFRRNAPASSAPPRPGLRLDAPILPYGIHIADADIEITARLISTEPIDITEASFAGRIRDGYLSRSPFAMTLGRIPLTGGIVLDLRGQVPLVELGLAGKDVDVGGLLRDLGVVETLEYDARDIYIDATLRGASLESIIRGSSLTASLAGGSTSIRDPNTGAKLAILVETSRLSVEPKRPIAVTIDGRIDSTPARFTIETDPLPSVLGSTDPVPVVLSADVAGMQLALSGNAHTPFSLRNLRFDLHAEGSRLDSLDQLVSLDLPPWGPYSVDGTFRLDSVGYHAPSLVVRVGDSHLTGDISLDTSGERPRLLVNLNGSTLQLDDFRTGSWSAFEADKTDDAAGDGASRARSLQSKADTVDAVINAKTLVDLNARLSVTVDEVLSGEDALGNGRLIATLENGLLELDPVSVSIPEGSADGRFSLRLTDAGMVTSTRVAVEHLDYGVLARRIDPDSDVKGWLSLEIDLDSESPGIDTLMAGSTGQFDFAVWPTNLQADIFDLWAANLLFALLPSIDSESGSRVNCVVGVFDLTDGLMQQQTFLVDTTNVQVAGEGSVDFSSGEVDFLLVPRAKRPTMFTLATPIQVRGRYTDLETSTTVEEWARTAVRFVTSVFAPIQRLFTTPISADGEAECLAAMERESG